MSVNISIGGVEKVMARLETAKVRVGKNPKPQVAVGFAAKYALFVHEMKRGTLELRPRPHGRGYYWDPQGMAAPKFLETPLRQLSPELKKMISDACKTGMPLEQALLLAGMRLQRESMLMVPVDTGYLKNSAFTALVAGN